MLQEYSMTSRTTVVVALLTHQVAQVQRLTPTKESEYFNWSGLHGATMLRLPSQGGGPTGGEHAGGTSEQTRGDEGWSAEGGCNKNGDGSYIGVQVCGRCPQIRRNDGLGMKPDVNLSIVVSVTLYGFIHGLVGFVIAIFFWKDMSVPIDLRNTNATIAKSRGHQADRQPLARSITWILIQTTHFEESKAYSGVE